MSYIVLTKENFEQEVLRSDQTVLVDFWAEWCGPCKAMAPVIDKIAEVQSAVKVGKVNVEAAPELAAQYRVMSIPTLILFRDGKVVRRETGGLSEDWILRMLQE